MESKNSEWNEDLSEMYTFGDWSTVVTKVTEKTEHVKPTQEPQLKNGEQTASSLVSWF